MSEISSVTPQSILCNHHSHSSSDSRYDYYLIMYNQDGRTPHHRAAQNRHLDIVKVLIEGKADVNLKTTVSDIVCMICCRIERKKKK